MGILSGRTIVVVQSVCVTHVVRPTRKSRSRLHIWRSEQIEGPVEGDQSVIREVLASCDPIVFGAVDDAGLH